MENKNLTTSVNHEIKLNTDNISLHGFFLTMTKSEINKSLISVKLSYLMYVSWIKSLSCIYIQTYTHGFSIILI